MNILLCSGCVLVWCFGFVNVCIWRHWSLRNNDGVQSQARETFELGDITQPFEGRCCAFFLRSIWKLLCTVRKLETNCVFDNFCFFLILFPKWRSSAAKNLQERWLRTWDEQVNWHVAAVDVMIWRSYDMIIMFKRIIIAVKTMMLWCFSFLSSTNRNDPIWSNNVLVLSSLCLLHLGDNLCFDFLPGFDCVGIFYGWTWGCFVDLLCFHLTCQVTQIGSDHVFFHVEAHITFRCDIKQLPGPSAICPSEDAGVTCLHFEHVVLLVSPGFVLCI
jgi:hypothetical protein